MNAGMNRLRLWLYMALLLLAGAGNLFFLSSWLGARSTAQMDRELRDGVALVDARARMFAADAGVLADAAARLPAIVAGLGDPSADLVSVAEEAIRPAAEALRIDPRTALVGIVAPRGAQARAAGAAAPLPETAPFVADPLRGVRRDAFARVGDTLYVIAGVPAGKGGAVVVGLPVEGRFASALQAVGLDVTIVAQPPKPAFSTLRDDAAQAVAGVAGQPPRRAVDVGRLSRVPGSMFPSLPLLFVSAPERRAAPIPFDGVPGAAAVLSVPAAPHYAGLATYQALALFALAVFLLLGIVLGLLMTEEGGRAVPRELLAAADRVNRGDFSARAPRLAGAVGVVANALNRATEAAEGWAPGPVEAAEPRAASAPETSRNQQPTSIAAAPVASDEPQQPSRTAELFAGALETRARAAEPSVHEPVAEPPPAEAPAPAAIAPASVEPFPADAPVPAEPEPTPARAAVEAAALNEPEPAGVPELPPPPPPEYVAPPRAEPFATAEPTFRAEPPPAAAAAPVRDITAFPAEDEEAHWRVVFDDFLRVRGHTGEAVAPVSFDRFRTKLQKNRDELVQKYSCRTVRFQVYVKEGKAAVRATPVR
jgi:hypothetical protein